MNVPEMLKYLPELAYKMDAICRILAEDEFYPADKIWETAIAILTEVTENA